jgi:succinate--hydroxymethylglutarate CoA-transferase
MYHLGSWSPPAAPLSENAPKVSSHLPPESAYFLAVNRNKRSITVNFKKPKGLEILRRLVAKADVLVENFIPGKLDSMGLGYADCNAINSKLIYASITGMFVPHSPQPLLTSVLQGYGQTGPYRTAAGYDVVIEGEAGLMHM